MGAAPSSVRAGVLFSALRVGTCNPDSPFWITSGSCQLDGRCVNPRALSCDGLTAVRDNSTVGARVEVIAGDYSGAPGTVQSLTEQMVYVRLDGANETTVRLMHTSVYLLAKQPSKLSTH